MTQLRMSGADLLVLAFALNAGGDRESDPRLRERDTAVRL